MPANPWELRADVRPLEAAAQRWTEIGSLVARRGDDLVEAARRTTEGWDAAAAESYEEHRRQVLAHLDRFTTLAERIADALRAVAAVVTSSQKELDRAWATVAVVPHEVVGESRHLVFTPSEDDERGKVTRGQTEAEDVRRRLTLALDQESARLRSARADLVTVRTELMSLTGGGFPGFVGPGLEESGVGTVPPASTSVAGAAQAGQAGVAAGLAPVAPVQVSVPDLGGISAAGLTPLAAGAAAGLLGRQAQGRRPASGTPTIAGGMGAGAMAARAGTMSRGMASGRGGPARMATPRLERTASEEAAARVAREKEAVREAKRSALEEKRAERAARKAEREARRQERTQRSRRESRDERRDDERRDPDDLDEQDAVEEAADDAVDGAPASEEPAERRQSVRVVHEAAPGTGHGEHRR